PLRKSLPFDEFHRDKFHFSKCRRSRVQIMYLADIEVTHLAGRAHFRGQVISVTWPGALRRPSPIQFLVDRFIDDSHPAAPNFAHDTEPLGQETAWTERVVATRR